MAKQNGRTAWLVTWEHIGDHAAPGCKIAAVLDPKLGGDTVRHLVDFLYSSLNYAPHEQLEIMARLRSNPYPAKFGSPRNSPAELWSGEVICGDNPFLRARRVDGLIIPAKGEAIWKERARPEMRVMNL